jgi:hypothetical protein
MWDNYELSDEEYTKLSTAEKLWISEKHWIAHNHEEVAFYENCLMAFQQCHQDYEDFDNGEYEFLCFLDYDMMEGYPIDGVLYHAR